MTRLPLDFPPLVEMAERAAREWSDLWGPAHSLASRASSQAILSDLTRPESQAVWLRWLAGQVGVPVPIGAPRWRRSGVTGPGWVSYTLGEPDGLGTPGLSRWLQFGAGPKWAGPATVSCPALPNPDSTDAPIRALVLAILTVGAG